MKFTEIYKNNGKKLSFEIFPPKAEEELNNIDETLSMLCELEPAFISVTFGAGGSSNNNKTIEIAKKIKNEYGVEPVVHLTCLSYDKYEIDSFCKELHDAGVENILALRGDHNPKVKEKGVFMHASDLISYIKPKTDFCIAGACYPEVHPDSESVISDVRNTKIKVDAGADVLLSQLFFDNDNFYRFVENCRIAGIDCPITPGIMPVMSAGQIRRMVTTCGAKMPSKLDKIINKYENKPEALADAGLYYAINQIIDLVTNDAEGIHLYTMNKPEMVKKICDAVKNII